MVILTPPSRVPRSRRIRGRGGERAVREQPRPRVGGLSPPRRSRRHTGDAVGGDRASRVPALSSDGVRHVDTVPPGTQAAVPTPRPGQGPSGPCDASMSNGPRPTGAWRRSRASGLHRRWPALPCRSRNPRSRGPGASSIARSNACVASFSRPSRRSMVAREACSRW